MGTRQRYTWLVIPAFICGLAWAAGWPTTRAIASDARCFKDWSEAAPIVRREGLVAIQRLARLAQRLAQAHIVDSMLCREQGRYFYRLVVRSANGTLRTLQVDARRPFEK